MRLPRGGADLAGDPRWLGLGLFFFLWDWFSVFFFWGVFVGFKVGIGLQGFLFPEFFNDFCLLLGDCFVCFSVDLNGFIVVL